MTVTCKTITATIPTTQCTGITGDITGEGNIDSMDVMFLNQAVAGTRILTECQLRRADINRDGYVDGTDAMFLNAYVSTGTCGGNCPQNIGQPIDPTKPVPLLI